MPLDNLGPDEPAAFSGTFPSLPIIPPEQARRPERERYGALFYLGISGLLVLAGLVAWFAWGAWSLRSVWQDVYTLHDPARSEADRIRAALALSHDPRVNQRQLWDIALRRPLPDLARYLVAEALTAEAASADPAGYGRAVARSEGWPVWLRLLLTRPIAYAAALDRPVDRPSLDELAESSDPATSLWAAYALAQGPNDDADRASTLRRESRADTPNRELAAILVKALDARHARERLKLLDEATRWVRRHHPASAAVWSRWTESGGRLEPRPSVP